MSAPALSIFFARRPGHDAVPSYRRHLLETCGLAEDQVSIHGWPEDSRNLCRLFNQALGRATGPFACFLRDDVSFEESPGWAVQLLREMASDEALDILGVAGASVLPEDGDWRHAQVSCGRVCERRGGATAVARYGGCHRRIVPAAALDGVLLFARTESIRRLRLDEERFEGSHFFDMELSMQAARHGLRLGVTGAIAPIHVDPPDRGTAWEASRLRFVEKYGADLPASALEPADLLPFEAWSAGTEGGNSIAVLIPVRDDVDQVRAAVSALQSRAPRRLHIAIYLVDLGSSPGSLGELRDLPGVRLLDAGGADFAGACNDLLVHGDAIREDLILFHGSGVQMVNDALSHLLLAWESTPGAGVVSARIHATDGLIDDAGRRLVLQDGRNLLLDRRGRGTLWDFDPATVRGGAAGSLDLALVDRCLFVHLGGFLEGCGWRDAEVDLGLKAILAGRTNVLAGGAVGVRSDAAGEPAAGEEASGPVGLASAVGALAAANLAALRESVEEGAPEASPADRSEPEGAGRPDPVELYDDPNRYARQPGLEIGEPIVVHGYQEFLLERERVTPAPIDEPLERKRCLVHRFYTKDRLEGKTVLDLGANGGFFSFWARMSGAAGVTALDMDPKYLELIRRAQEGAGLDRIRTAARRVQDWDEPADIVLAFALVHWLYSCTAAYGSLDGVIHKLAGLTRELLIVEWVAPGDPAIAFFRHTEWNAAIASGPYTREAFEAALRDRFPRIEILGDISSTRILYAAYRQPNEIAPSPELPLIFPRELLLSARCLTELDGVRYHSAVYLGERQGTVVKHTTGSLAWHEAAILRRLHGPFFPRVVSARREEDSSVAVLEWIEGNDLSPLVSEIACRPRRLASFFADSLEILKALREAQVRHRDIRIENLRVRGGRPVLIDFGWAEADGVPYLTPGALGGTGRPPDGGFCDVYSMGNLFRRLIPSGNEDLFAPLLRPMTAPWPARRQTDPAILRSILLGLELPQQWCAPAAAAVSAERRIA